MSERNSQTRPRELTYSTALCDWGQDLYGQCRPFSYLSNIPFMLRAGKYYSFEELVPILEDPRFMHYSLTISSTGLNGQRLARATKQYPTSWVLQYWNAYEKYRPGSQVTNTKIPAKDLLYSLQYVLHYELRNDEIEVVDESTHERIFIYIKMDNFENESINYVDTVSMFDPGASGGLRAGL